MRCDHSPPVAAARMKQVGLGALRAIVDLGPLAGRPCRQGQGQGRASWEPVRVIDLVV
jgi:hypothetical protein